ncbi:MAG: transposase [Patescibacteria group bacterium]|nr:transposase [Patescibacteria group bacterium]
MENKHRKSIRLKEYNYSDPSDYFITICTQDRECLFGEVVDGEMRLNEVGKIVEQCYLEIPKHFSNIELDIFQIMPNHVHFILRIVDDDTDCRGGVPPPDKENILIQGGETPPLRSEKPTLGQMVGYFKYQSTKEINMFLENPGNRIFQRNYYEEIIKNEKHYSEVYDYILSNPQTWIRDKNNPLNFIK